MADKKINISLNISAQTQELKTKIQDIQKTLNNVRMPDFDRNSMTKELASLQTRLEKLTQISNKPAGFLKASDMRQAEKEIGNIQSALRGMTQQIERVEGLSKKEKLKLFPEDTQNKIKNITKAIKEYNDAVDNQTKREKASLTAKNRLLDAREKVAKLEEKQKTSFQGKQPISNNDYQQYKKQYEQYSKDFKEIDEFRRKEGFQWNKKYDKTQQVDFKGQVMSAERLHEEWKQLQEDSKKYNELSNGIYHLKELKKYPIICLGKGTKTYEFFSNIFLKYGLSFQPDIEVATTDLILPMVKNELGIGFIPENFIKNNNEIIKVNLAEKIPNRSISLIKDINKPLSIAARELEKLLYQ